MKVVIIDDEIKDSLKPFLNDLKSYSRFAEPVGAVLEFVSVTEFKMWLKDKGDSLDIDLAIIDQFIGSERGTELGAWISENHSHIACVLLTGGGPENNKENNKGPILDIAVDALRTGFCDFLLKSQALINIHDALDLITDLSSFKAKQIAKNALLENRRNSFEEYETFGLEVRLDLIEKFFQNEKANSKNKVESGASSMRRFKLTQLSISYALDVLIESLISDLASELPDFTTIEKINRNSIDYIDKNKEVIKEAINRLIIDKELEFNIWNNIKKNKDSRNNTSKLKNLFDRNRFQMNYLFRIHKQKWRETKINYPIVKKYIN